MQLSAKILLVLVVVSIIGSVMSTAESEAHHGHGLPSVSVHAVDDSKFPWMKRFMTAMASRFKENHGDNLKFYDSRVLKDAQASVGKERLYIRKHRGKHLSENENAERRKYQRMQEYYKRFGYPIVN
eukprot:TRINITY_DN447_c0_g2_i1.p1 TRINITY_DN447_c0_g2~~TRINITY_DN447_c0_g2_i1.p1  ORF type:complete len:136 (-),score=24.44 TRINITY_DN447_c0_g2_i1:34-414(-)